MPSIREMQQQVSEIAQRVSGASDELWQLRTLTFGNVVSVSKNYSRCKVKLHTNDTTVDAQIIRHPNELNIVGHIRVGDIVLVMVQKNNFDAHVLMRLHDKTLEFGKFPCYKNNDTVAWGIMAA